MALVELQRVILKSIFLGTLMVYRVNILLRKMNVLRDKITGQSEGTSK